MICSFWLSCGLLTAVSALRWPGPKETLSATLTADWTPTPTNRVDVALKKGELLKRSLYPLNLCGWQGPGHQDVLCSERSSCAWFTDYKVVGCCSIGGSCGAVHTSYVDYQNPWYSAPPTPGIYTCTGNDLCYANTYPGEYSQFGCGTTTIGQIVVTSWTGMNPAYSIQIVLTGNVLPNKAPLSDADRITVSEEDVGSSKAESRAVSSTTTTITSSAPGSPSKDSPAATTASSVAENTAKDPPTQASPAPPSKASPTISSLSNDPSVTPGATPGAALTSTLPSKVKSLSTGVIIGISVVPTVITIIGVALLIFCFCVRRRKRKTLAQFPAAGGTPYSPAYDQHIMGGTNSPAQPYQHYQPHEKEAQYTLVAAQSHTPELDSRRHENTQSLAPPYEASMLQSPATDARTYSVVSDQSSTVSPTPTIPYQSHFPDIYEMPENRAFGTRGATAGLSELDDLQIRNK